MSILGDIHSWDVVKFDLNATLKNIIILFISFGLMSFFQRYGVEGRLSELAPVISRNSGH